MAADLHLFLTRDHERLDALLSACVRADGSIDYEPYAQFRAGLLRHIAIEERILFPLFRVRRAALEEQLHRDHAALSALLVPPPTADEIERIRQILVLHNPLEEDEGGLYELIEGLAGDELNALMERVHAIPEVRLAPHADSPIVRSSIEQLVKQAMEGR
jgi:hypothetical protein